MFLPSFTCLCSLHCFAVLLPCNLQLELFHYHQHVVCTLSPCCVMRAPCLFSPINGFPLLSTSFFKASCAVTAIDSILVKWLEQCMQFY